MISLAQQWVGTYNTWNQAGGVQIGWSPYGTLEITAGGDVYINGSVISNVTVISPDSISWDMPGYMTGQINFGLGTQGDGYYFFTVINSAFFTGQYVDLTTQAGAIDFKGLIEADTEVVPVDALLTTLSQFGDTFSSISTAADGTQPSCTFVIDGVSISITFSYVALTKKWTADFDVTYDLNGEQTFSGSAEVEDDEWGLVHALTDPINIGPFQFAGPPDPANETGAGAAPDSGSDGGDDSGSSSSSSVLSFPSDPYDGGPEFKIAFKPGEGGTVSFNTGINFFGQATIAAEIGLSAVDKPEPEEGKEIKLSFDLRGPQLFGNTLALQIEYTKSEGFSISGWPDTVLSDNLKSIWDQLEDAYEDANKNDENPCQAITETFVNNVFTGNFSVQPTVTADTNGLNFSFGGALSLVIGIAPASTTINLPFTTPLLVTVPSASSGSSYAGIAASLFAGIAEALPPFFMANGTALTTFLSAIFAESQLSSIAAKFICSFNKIPGNPPLINPFPPITIPGGSYSNPIKLDTPQGLMVSDDDSGPSVIVTVTWNAVSYATGYSVSLYRVAVPEGACFSTTVTTPSIRVDNLPLCGYHLYSINVQATGGGGTAISDSAALEVGRLG